ncbi:MAG TPA: hypothetical protein IAA03_06520 [Candidatus Ruminococcus avistercoris]|nr:hypothetical protein [Candidatus Ruminococcus avistercoris]
MCRIIGFMLFFIGIGMLIELLIPTALWDVITAVLCLIVGYHMFCCS